MADLDALSNDELRLRLLEAGYSNMPVTSTTRKVLIKKLRNHLEGEKAKTRRETIHVTKYSSGEEDDVDVKKTSSRRTTMGVPLSRGPAPRTRKSVDRTPAPVVEEKKSSPRRSSRQTPQKIVNYDEEESDEELSKVELKLIEERRKSKSPSLTRSKIVTTTYKNKTTIAESDEADEVEPLPEKPRRPSPARPGLERSNDLRKRATLASTSYAPPETTTTITSPKFNRPLLSTSYNAYTSPTRYSTTAAAADSNGTFNETIDLDYKSPYLSDFTRRLSQLNAEPLSPMKPAIPKGTGIYYRTGKNSQVPMNSQPDTLGASFRDVFHSLASYRKTFIVIAVFLVLLFFFVMFYL